MKSADDDLEDIDVTWPNNEVDFYHVTNFCTWRDINSSLSSPFIFKTPICSMLSWG